MNDKILRAVVLLTILSSIIFAQDKLEYFLNHPNNYKNLPESISNKVYQELVKIHKEWTNEINIESLYLENFTERVITGQYFDESAYLTALLSMNNPTEAEAFYLKQLCTRTTYANMAGSKNRTIDQDKSVFWLSPSWDDVVKHFGGYAELAKMGVTKSKYNKGEYKVVGKLYEIEIASEGVCYAHVKLEGDLKFHDIVSEKVKYAGKYILEETNFTNIYKYKANVPKVYFSLAGGKYMQKTDLEIPLTEIIDRKEFNSVSYKYAEALVIMINDYVSDDVFEDIDDIKAIRKAQSEKREKSHQRYLEQKQEEQKKEQVLLSKQKLQAVHDFEYSPVYYYISGGTFSRGFNEELDGQIEGQANAYTAGVGFIGKGIMVNVHASYYDYTVPNNLELTEGWDETEVHVQSPKLNGFSGSFEIGYDVSKEKYPVRPFIGLGYKYSVTNLTGNDYSGFSEGEYNLYYFGELITKTFWKPNLFFGVRYGGGLSFSEYDGVSDARPFQGMSLKIGRSF